MTLFTVEAITKPVYDESGWLPLRRITDLVPGTILLEDGDEPMLVIPVVASSPTRAALFVEGILKLVEVEFVSGAIRLADDEEDDEPPVLSPEAEREHTWAESVSLTP
ncbi:hypothetical protein [Mycolicibacterium grossiae]|uniref:Uncharacterized protein n=1 Tax=Mycolicibacterium grossiae TaxID=1552759 RepID=A0A1E8Q202_9MYCO|nr:hypothetical protein [Mycolicibacterium grossiae]OFJ52565.1 hypothetical protein BEL07_17120 [Mycolicibacterium grossiae]QEM47173.1 hypothetical protein FZ046_22495 [Mycolicibacterium grossiae]